jgi:methyl-accepting chemotaxis protein
VSGTADVVINVPDAAQGASETGDTSGRMFASAQALSSESLHLKTEIEKFLDGVRARAGGMMGAPAETPKPHRS